ncbi:hypothetical protein [Nocardia jejuensis]|uniref:hypothetical protein n=1 Tax=Nocardia jejuensis TaxID=328049 RepID=UPI000AD6181D|nr:hypothetical protein [Nocardia jejuensis]
MTPNSEPPGRRPGTIFALAALAAVVVLGLAAIAYFGLIRDSGDDTGATPTLTPTASVTGPATSGPPANLTGSPPSPEATTASGPETTTAPPTSGTPVTFAYQPLWPFASAAEAIAWQQSYHEGGHQPWHLDPSAVALNFTRGYLGYTDLDRVLLATTKGEESWITIGYGNPNGVGIPAAELHLARLGAGADMPWEVVGTEDRTLTIATPEYGAKVGSPLAVGGHVTGVDESLRVRIHQLTGPRSVGEIPGIPAGGTDSPWSGTVPFTGTCPGVLTVAVSTGGHVAEVERFAVTGVHC